MAEPIGPRTVAALRDLIATRLTGHVEEPQAEARELLASLHDAPRSWSTAHASDELIDLLRDAAMDAVERRLAGAPMAYATGRAAFRHLFLTVDERVLIPRPETEELVSLALPYITEGSVVVDAGTGSGAIALAIAQESRAGRIIGTDISPGAIEVAELNARATLQREYARTEFLLGNLLEPVEASRIDVILSNPPYIALNEREALPVGVRDWEPATALFGGADGMTVIRALVAQAEVRLGEGGVLLMEVDARRAREAADCADGSRWQDVRIVPDLFGRDRFVVAKRTAEPARTEPAGRGAPRG